MSKEGRLHSEQYPEQYTLSKALNTPAHIASLAFGHAGHLFAGCDDGSLRIYDLSSFKVLKAVRGLGAEVSSIVCMKRPGSELRDAWIAHGQKVSKFQMESPKMIQDLSDAIASIEFIDVVDDVLNELALNANKSHLAFSLDSGHVGVVDLSNNAVTKMETKHSNVCGSVQFVPGRPRELVSGGYDTLILHFDYSTGKVLSQQQTTPDDAVGGIALSPPFITSMAMSTTGVLAAGTADGRLFIGFGGEKVAPTKKKGKKKDKKWEGLDEDQYVFVKAAEGPIVAMAFPEPRKLITSTMRGILTYYKLIYDEAEGTVLLQQMWQKKSDGLEKVNALVSDEKRIIVGGFSADNKGVIEVWKLSTSVKKVT